MSWRWLPPYELRSLQVSWFGCLFLVFFSFFVMQKEVLRQETLQVKLFLLINSSVVTEATTETQKLIRMNNIN